MRSQEQILVTGARGFIGSAVFKRLTSRGYQVTSLAGDIRDPLPYADIIVHCAGRKNDESDSYEVNVNGARNLLATRARIINVSTAAARLPRKGLYGSTKAEADEILKGQVTLRFSLIYGDGGILKTLIRWTRFPIVPFYGNAIFRPIYIEDVAEIIEQAFTWPNGTYDIGGPDPVTLRELIQDVANIFHRKQVYTMPLPRFMARLQLTQSNVLGAEQTVTFTTFYGRPLLEGLRHLCNQMS